jgi:cardiolipin synthase
MRLPRLRSVIGVILIVVAIVAMALLVAQDQATLRVRSPLAADDPKYPEYLSRLLGHRLTSADAVTVLTDGDAAFPAMLEAIARARHRVSFETYIFDKGTVGTDFVEAFRAATARGVSVRMILDSIGSKTFDPTVVRALQHDGVQLSWFNPVASYKLEDANYRTHRKVLVVDGETAFVGGIGIADHWARTVGKEPKWRDTHIEVHGPVALDIEAAFDENWIQTGNVVAPDILSHGLPAEGHDQAIAVWSSPSGGANAMKLLYLLAIAAARRRLDIQSPYFITDESTQWSLLDARKRGVHVRVVVEGEITDAKPVKYASRALYEPLLRAGVEIFEYQPAMMHTKAMMVDDSLTITGSANFDNRSLELNEELNVVVFDKGTAARLREDFERDIQQSKKLTFEAWRARPIWTRAHELAWSYFGEVF